MPTRIRTTHETAPGGGAVRLALPRAGLNLAISAMVAPTLRGTIEVMTRRNCLWLAAGLAACRRSTPARNLFPATVAGVWHRTALRELSPGDAPDPVSRSVINRLEAASYEGPGKLEARIYELESPGVALELVQRWRPSADTVFFYRQQYFVVIKWQDADRKALTAFVSEVEKSLGKPNEPS